MKHNHNGNEIVFKRISVEADGDYENCMINTDAPTVKGYIAVKRVSPARSDEFDDFDDDASRNYSDTIYIKWDKITTIIVSENELSKIKDTPYIKWVQGVIIGSATNGNI